MQKLILILLFSFTLSTCFNTTAHDAISPKFPSESELLYNKMKLNDTVDYELFRLAFNGYKKVKDKRKSILTLVDFNKPSTEKRFYVIDMEQERLLYTTHVAHGKNSGGDVATQFSNRSGSFQSSLGFYLTSNTYQGRNGYSLRLQGLEAGINDHAMSRAIVIHGAPYANPSVIPSLGRLGRSLGCPALPQEVSKEVIDTIKEGTLLFIYSKTADYTHKSELI